MQDAFDTLYADTKKEIGSLVDGYVAGYLTPQEFGDQMAALLEDKHTDAAVLGRNHAGDDSPVHADDKEFAAQVVDGESEYLAQFVKDLEAGRYLVDGLESADAIGQRAGMYANKLVGTANETWGLAQDGDTELVWTLGAANNCDGCIEIEAGSPYTVDTIPTWPGNAETPCLANCLCTVTNAAGQTAFRRPDAENEEE